MLKENERLTKMFEVILVDILKTLCCHFGSITNTRLSVLAPFETIYFNESEKTLYYYIIILSYL